jgi:hypothetical protein
MPVIILLLQHTGRGVLSFESVLANLRFSLLLVEVVRGSVFLSDTNLAGI